MSDKENINSLPRCCPGDHSNAEANKVHELVNIKAWQSLKAEATSREDLYNSMNEKRHNSLLERKKKKKTKNISNITLTFEVDVATR